MSFKIWFKKNVMKQTPTFKLGNLEMACYCNDHMNHSNCDAKCHRGLTDNEVFEKEKPLQIFSDIMKPTLFKCKYEGCGRTFHSDVLIEHLMKHGLIKRKFDWDWLFTEFELHWALIPTVNNLNPDYIEEVVKP